MSASPAVGLDLATGGLGLTALMKQHATLAPLRRRARQRAKLA